MKHRYTYLFVIIVVIASAAWVRSYGAPHDRDERSGCTLYVLKSIEGEVVVDTVALPEGRTVVLGADDIITFILPLSPGQSGDLIQEGQPKGSVVVRCEGGALHVVVRFEDGRERRLPPVDAADLAGYDIRVNVVGGDGTKRAFVIRAYGNVEPAGGPVVNMFGSAIPLEEGDYSITTEVTEHRPPAPVEGSAALTIVDGFLLAEGTLPGGAKGSFIVDFGASGTVVDHSFVPENTPVQRVKAIEYSEGDGHELDGTMGGAGGSVAGFVGSAPLAGFELGSVSFGDVTVSVIREMPDFIVDGVVGIIGLDLLRRADVAALEFVGDGEAVLTFSDRRRSAKDQANLTAPFKISLEHIFVAGSVHGVPVDFLVDSGARYSILTRLIAEEAGLTLSEHVARDFRGLDESPIPARTALVDSFALGDHAMTGRHFYVADLPVFESIGLSGSGALLGMDFLDDYRLVEFDFAEAEIILHTERPPRQ